MDKPILVTGGPGSIGKTIVTRLLADGYTNIRVYSRSEDAQYWMQQELSNPAVRYLIGDIRDLPRLSTACRDVDTVYHAAAMKHVSACAYNPFEAVQTNVVGTQNVITASINAGVDKVILISSDKAAGPANTLGATKYLAEHLIRDAASWSSTRLYAVRLGNILWSRGSVLPTWMESAKTSRTISLINPHMVRFIMQRTEVMPYIEDVCSHKSGAVLIPHIKYVAMQMLADAFIAWYSNQTFSSRNTIQTGCRPDIIKGAARPNEKVSEELLTTVEEYTAGYHTSPGTQRSYWILNDAENHKRVPITGYSDLNEVVAAISLHGPSTLSTT